MSMSRDALDAILVEMRENSSMLSKHVISSAAGAAIEEMERLHSLLNEAQDNICAAYCPAVKRTGDEWPHVDLCERLKSEQK